MLTIIKVLELKCYIFTMAAWSAAVVIMSISLFVCLSVCVSLYLVTSIWSLFRREGAILTGSFTLTANEPVRMSL